MLQLAKLLYHSGFHVTFVTQSSTTRASSTLELLTRPAPSPPSASGPFPTASRRPTPTAPKTSLPSPTPPARTAWLLSEPLLSELNGSSSADVPPVTCIVSDGAMSFTLTAAQELGIPEVLFWTTSACGFIGYAHYSLLREKGFLPLKGSNLWKEDRSCLEWLDSREANFVVYVNFGSITVMINNQLMEFAWGLANSNQSFLWII
ncbi:7-deoxyloganetin glucosyltransferase-like [Malania oleifera]|uniref:7-deoxyloganetin glucosyltransferase-like n=1 Tax=Malania oleifera TaxID=397392 RepID=UPI0025ADC21F|nr:7-deoxyloganetin glucosyltransferase-like [Malania oleifera]